MSIQERENYEDHVHDGATEDVVLPETLESLEEKLIELEKGLQRTRTKDHTNASLLLASSSEAHHLDNNNNNEYVNKSRKFRRVKLVRSKTFKLKAPRRLSGLLPRFLSSMPDYEREHEYHDMNGASDANNSD